MATRMGTVTEEDLLTRREAAELAGVHLNTIRLWENTGRVHTTKTDTGVVMIPRSEIEGIIEQRRDTQMDDKARIAALETENRMLREELDASRNREQNLRQDYKDLLDKLVEITTTEEG